MGKLSLLRTMNFFLGLLIGLVLLGFYWRRNRRSLAYWKNLLYQEQQNNQRLNQEHQAIQQELFNLRNDYENLTQEQAKLTEALTQIQQENQQSTLIDHHPNLQHDYQKILAEHQQLQDEFLSLQSGYETRIQRTVALIQDLEQKTEEYQAIQQELFNLRNDYESLTQERAKLTEQIRQLLQENQQLKLQSNLHQETTQKLEQENQKLKQEQAKLTEALTQLQQENQQLTLIDHHPNLQHEYEKILAEHRQLQDEFLSLQSGYETSIQRTVELIQEYHQVIQDLEQENEKLKDERDYYEQCAIETEEKLNKTQREQSQIYHMPSTGERSRRGEKSELLGQQQIILYSGEVDFYEDELYEMILSIFQEELNRIPSVHKRRQHLLQSLLDFNSSRGIREKMKEKIKDTFFNYTGLNQHIQRGLHDLGFELCDKTKNHYKIIWRNDSRYVFSFAKTPSDYRASLNIVRDLTHLLF